MKYMKCGVAGNGRSGRWYVEIESQWDDNDEAYALEIHNKNQEIRFNPLFTSAEGTAKDLDHLIEALQQARKDLYQNNDSRT